MSEQNPTGRQDADSLQELRMIAGFREAANAEVAATKNWEALLPAMGGMDKLLADVLGMLSHEAPRLAQQFEAGVSGKDWISAKRAVHTLKSNVRYVGLEAVSTYAASLEQLVVSGKYAALPDHVQPVLDLCSAITRWCTEVLACRPK